MLNWLLGKSASSQLIKDDAKIGPLCVPSTLPDSFLSPEVNQQIGLLKNSFDDRTWKKFNQLRKLVNELTKIIESL